MMDRLVSVLWITTISVLLTNHVVLAFVPRQSTTTTTKSITRSSYQPSFTTTTTTTTIHHDDDDHNHRVVSLQMSKLFIPDVGHDNVPTKKSDTQQQQQLSDLKFTYNKKYSSSNQMSKTPPTTKTTKLSRTKTVGSSIVVGCFLLWQTLFSTVPNAVASSSLYDTNDYASETVQRVIRELKDNTGSVDGTIKVYEEIAAIITEGKGIGGSINYQGVQLERGYVSDEDTTIYNPGLTLLTESEKSRLVDAIVESKRVGTSTSQWNVDTQAGYDYLREKLDPYHTYELQGFLQFVPYYGAAIYLIVLAIQQIARDIFPPAYIIGAITFFIPIIILVSIGPQ